MKFDLCTITWETILSITLVISGIYQFYRQYKLEEKIAKRNSKISLYQYRVECYKKLIEVHSILLNLGGNKLLTSNIEHLDIKISAKLTEGRNLMFSAYQESCFLFPSDVSHHFANLNEIYGDIYNIVFSMIFDDKNRINEVKKILEVDSNSELLALPQKRYGENDELFTIRGRVYIIFPEILSFEAKFEEFGKTLDSMQESINSYMNLKDIERNI